MIGPKQVYNNERGNLMNKIFSTIVALVVEVIPSSSFDIFSEMTQSSIYYSMIGVVNKNESFFIAIVWQVLKAYFA